MFCNCECVDAMTVGYTRFWN